MLHFCHMIKKLSQSGNGQLAGHLAHQRRKGTVLEQAHGPSHKASRHQPQQSPQAVKLPAQFWTMGAHHAVTRLFELAC